MIMTCGQMFKFTYISLQDHMHGVSLVSYSQIETAVMILMSHNHPKDLGQLNLITILWAKLVTTVQDLLLNLLGKGT